MMEFSAAAASVKSRKREREKKNCRKFFSGHLFGGSSSGVRLGHTHHRVYYRRLSGL